MPLPWRMLLRVSRFLSPVRYKSVDGLSESSRMKEASAAALPDD